MSNHLIHITFESELLVRDCIKACSSGYLTLVLKKDGKNGVLTNSGLLELEHWSAISLKLIRLFDLKSGEGSFTTKFEAEFSSRVFHVTIVDDGFEDTTVLHHGGWVETNSYILVLVRVNSETFRLNVKRETFTLGLRAWLYCELNCAGDLVGVDNLEALLSSFWVLRGYHSSEPEDILLHREEARADDSLSVQGWVQRGNHRLFFKDLIIVVRVDSWDGRLGTKLERDTVWQVDWVLIRDVDADSAIIELGTLSVESYGDYRRRVRSDRANGG